VNDINASGVRMRSASARELLIDLHERYGPQLAEFMAASTHSRRRTSPVSWAGEEQSPMWFDVARELTERWHHQQQIRDAVGRPPLYELPRARARHVRARVPYTYRDVDAPEGTTIVLRITMKAKVSGRSCAKGRAGSSTPMLPLHPRLSSR
jgi:hypothetical protein